MPAIGHVTRDANGTYKGQLKTLSIRTEIAITPSDTPLTVPVWRGTDRVDR